MATQYTSIIEDNPADVVMKYKILKSHIIHHCPRGCDGHGTVRDPVTLRRKTCPKCGGGRKILLEVVEPVRDVAA